MKGGEETPPPPPEVNVVVNSNANQVNNTKTGINTIIKTNILYSSSDKGPFIVYLESTDKVGFNIGKFNNIKIARDIFNLNLTDVIKISNKGLNRIAIQFISYISANSFVNNKTLLDKGYNIFIPFNFVTSKGIARNVDFDLSEEEILKTCKAYNNIKILNAKRLNRKTIKNDITTYEPTGTVLFTFQGVNLPRSVNIYGLEFQISIYVAPVTQCFRCLRYGHTKTNCKGKEKCLNCAGDIHPQEGDNMPCMVKCFYCKDSHKSNFKKCPEYVRQKNIKELMAFENLTFYEANELCRKTYVSRDEFIYNGEDYPALKKKYISTLDQKNEGTIYPADRRSQAFKNGAIKRSYQHVASLDNNKKRIIHKGYDRKAHNENLMLPNSRPIKTSHASQPLYSQQSTAQQPSSNETNIPPSSSATSNSYLNSQFSHFDLATVVNYFRYTSDTNKDICRELLCTELRTGAFADLDRGSDYSG